VYDVVDSSQSPALRTTVTVDVDHPYTSRTVTEGSGGYATDGRQAYVIQPDGTVSTVAPVPPTFPSGALHLDVARASAPRHPRATQAGGDTVAGRPCELWRSKDPLDAEPIAPADSGSSTVSCVDADGRLLRDAWTLHGKVVRTRTATKVGAGPSLSGSALLAGRTPSPAPSIGTAEGVKVVPRDVLLQALGIAEPSAPAGLPADRDAATIVRDGTGQVTAEGGVLTWADCCRRLVVLQLERGLTHRLTVPDVGVPVTLGPGRPAHLEPVGLGLRLVFGVGHFVVTITADLPEDELLAWASGLQLG
jgi:hypothetical protein